MASQMLSSPICQVFVKVSLLGTVAGSFRIRKKNSSPGGPYFPGTFHSMDAVRKPTLSIGSNWCPNALPKSAFPTNFRGNQRPPLRGTFHRSLAPRTMIRIFHSFQGCVQRNSWIFEVLFPKVLILSRVFTISCLHAWRRSIFLPPPWLPSFSRGLFAFWACGFFTRTALLNSL